MKPWTLAITATLLLVRGVSEAQPAPPISVPKAYGTNFQTLHVGASAFQPAFPFDFSFEGFGDGYVYSLVNEFLGVFAAPVTLPPGAEVHAICAYLFDDLSEADVQVQFRSGRLVPGGPPPGTVQVGPSAQSSWDTGYGVTCVDFAPPYTYSEAAAEDGVFLQHYLYAYVPFGNAVGGVKIIWRRQVSPPPATPTFGDVPPGDAAYPFIEALAASGITAGCAGGNYCPDANLTRRQMAVFLSKALGLHWPY